MSNRITKAQQEKITKLYLDGKTGPQIAKEIGCCTSSIYNILVDAKVTARPSWCNNRHYFFNENFFDNIDNEYKAYWLGFITADGCVQDNYSLVIGLKREDKLHMENFCRTLGIEGKYPIRESYSWCNSKQYKTCVTTINSVRLIADLKKLGVISRKSAKEIPWQSKQNLTRDYFRGIIDGDGWLGKYQHRNKTEWFFGLCGSKEMLLAFSEFVRNELQITLGKLRPKGKYLWILQCAGTSKPQKIVKLLYGNCNVALPRKKARADELLNMPY